MEFEMNPIEIVESNHKEFDQFGHILRYLYLLKEEATIIHMFGYMVLFFDNGFKNKELKLKLQEFMISENTILIFPINDFMKNRIAEIIFSY